MFVLMLGVSVTFGAAVFAAAVYSEGAIVALRTAAQVIGWLLMLATLAGLAGLRSASLSRIGAAAVTLCSGVAVLSMSYLLDWDPAIRHAAAEAAPARPAIALAAPPVVKAASAPQLKAAPAPQLKAAPAPQLKVASAARPVSPAGGRCATLTGVEALQCNRCSETLGVAWVVCQEQVRLQYCDSKGGDERTCPSPIPVSHPG